MTTNGNEPAFPTQYLDTPAGRAYAEMLGGLTARQYAAIHLCVPKSGEPWLDDMIREALRDRMAGQALTGMLAHYSSNRTSGDQAAMAAQASYALADALLSAKEGK